LKCEIEILEAEGYLLLTLCGDISLASLKSCFYEVNEILRYNFHLKILIDGNGIEDFLMSNTVCQQIAPQLFNFPRRAAFFSKTPFVFGMLRVFQASSFNDNFRVFKSEEKARRFLQPSRQSEKVDDEGR